MPQLEKAIEAQQAHVGWLCNTGGTAHIVWSHGVVEDLGFLYFK